MKSRKNKRRAGRRGPSGLKAAVSLIVMGALALERIQGRKENARSGRTGR